MNRAKRGAFAALLALAWVGAMGRIGTAATVSIGPTRLVIAHGGASVDLSLTNLGNGSVSYIVRPFAWHQDPLGGIGLDPTDDVIVYPQRITLGPQEKRAIRIGFPGGLRPIESDYRILITETAASTDAAAGGTALIVRSRFSVPLFVAPNHPTTGIDASAAVVTKNDLSFSLAATGTTHVVASAVHVTASDDAGRPVFSATLPAWYQLPGEPRIYHYNLPPGSCAQIAHLTVDASFEAAPPLHVSLAPARTC